jgi:hypothetical protein
VKVADSQIVVLQDQLSDEIRALPLGPARWSDHAKWLQAAWSCAKVALGQQRAQAGSSRAKARALCARIIEGETVPIDELLSATTPKSKRQHATKKTARQLDNEIAEALRQPRSKSPASEVIAAFNDMADTAESNAGENLYLGRRELGYTGDSKDFRFSDLCARQLPGEKYAGLIGTIDEARVLSTNPLGRKLTDKEAEWMRREAKKIYEEERQHIDNVLRERNH